MDEELSKTDTLLMELLVESESIEGFLDGIFCFLYKRTDFYIEYENDDDDENRELLKTTTLQQQQQQQQEVITADTEYVGGDGDERETVLEPFGFPTSANEQLVLATFQKYKNLQSCSVTLEKEPTELVLYENPLINIKNCNIIQKELSGNENTQDIINGTAVPEAIQTIDIPSGNNSHDDLDEQMKEINLNIFENNNNNNTFNNNMDITTNNLSDDEDDDNSADNEIDFQLADYYNGAIYDRYCWSQTYSDIEIRIKIPKSIKSAKQLNVRLGKNRIDVFDRVTDFTLFSKQFAYACRHTDAVWNLCENKKLLLINFAKQTCIWWEKLCITEPKINVHSLDCARPMEELPEIEQIAIERIQTDFKQKLLGHPTSTEYKNIQLLEKAWNIEGSPFKGTQFDPAIVQFN